jgi:hypothetical protein
MRVLKCLGQVYRYVLKRVYSGQEGEASASSTMFINWPSLCQDQVHAHTWLELKGRSEKRLSLEKEGTTHHAFFRFMSRR